MEQGHAGWLSKNVWMVGAVLKYVNLQLFIFHQQGLLYAFSIPAYYQRGQALIFTFKYKFSRKLSAYFKLKSDLSNSYLDSEISKYEFKCLLKWQF